MGTLQEDPSEHSFHLLLVLLETIQQAVKYNPKQQKVFRVVDTFVQLVCRGSEERKIMRGLHFFILYY
jgi:hypothetical protein